LEIQKDFERIRLGLESLASEERLVTQYYRRGTYKPPELRHRHNIVSRDNEFVFGDLWDGVEYYEKWRLELIAEVEKTAEEDAKRELERQQGLAEAIAAAEFCKPSLHDDVFRMRDAYIRMNLFEPVRTSLHLRSIVKVYYHLYQSFLPSSSFHTLDDFDYYPSSAIQQFLLGDFTNWDNYVKYKQHINSDVPEFLTLLHSKTFPQYPNVTIRSDCAVTIQAIGLRLKQAITIMDSINYRDLNDVL
jgi:hypothetical protein